MAGHGFGNKRVRGAVLEQKWTQMDTWAATRAGQGQEGAAVQEGAMRCQPACHTIDGNGGRSQGAGR